MFAHLFMIKRELLVCDDAKKFSYKEAKCSAQWQVIESEEKAKNNSQEWVSKKAKVKGNMIEIILKTKYL